MNLFYCHVTITVNTSIREIAFDYFIDKVAYQKVTTSPCIPSVVVLFLQP